MKTPELNRFISIGSRGTIQSGRMYRSVGWKGAVITTRNAKQKKTVTQKCRLQALPRLPVKPPSVRGILAQAGSSDIRRWRSAGWF